MRKRPSLRSALSLAITLLLFASPSFAEDGRSAGSSLGQSTLGVIGSEGGIRENMTNPITSANSPMKTIDRGTDFNAQLVCPSSERFLDVFVTVGSTGDVYARIAQDTDLDGALDHEIRPPYMSGVCSNGFVTCDPAGSWDNCKYFKWTADSSLNAGYELTAIMDLGGCYCINNDCGNNLVWNNLPVVLKDIGSGIASAIQARSPQMAISDVKIDGTHITYYGQSSGQCGSPGQSGTSNPEQYFGNAGGMAAASEEEMISQVQNPDSYYNLITQSAAMEETASELRTCTVNRQVELDELALYDIIAPNGGTGRVTTCGKDCLNIVLGHVGDNYWCGHCKIYEIYYNVFVKRKELIDSATLVRTKWDDYMQIWTGRGQCNEVAATQYFCPSTGDGYWDPYTCKSNCTVRGLMGGTVNQDCTTTRYVCPESGNTYMYRNQCDLYCYRRDYRQRTPVPCEVAPPVTALKYQCINDGRVYDSSSVCGASCMNKIWAGPNNNFPPETGGACELATSWDWNPNLDVTQFFKVDGNVQTKVRVSVAGCGEGFAYIRVRVKDQCLLHEGIQDNCKSLDEDEKCQIKEEKVDGVLTYRQFNPTGLAPTSSCRNFSGSICSKDVCRAWWKKERTYLCELDEEYNFEDVRKRVARVESTATDNTTTMTYSDLRKDAQGNWIAENLQVNLNERGAYARCEEACKTRKVVQPPQAGTPGHAGGSRYDATTYDFFYKVCQDSVCPAELGEEIIKDCQCINEFAEATAIMETLNQASKDIICSDGVPK